MNLFNIIIQKANSFLDTLEPKEIRRFVFKLELFLAMGLSGILLLILVIFEPQKLELIGILGYTFLVMLLSYYFYKKGEFKKSVWSYMIFGSGSIILISFCYPAAKMEGLFLFLIAVSSMLFLGKNNKSLQACIVFCILGTASLVQESLFQDLSELNNNSPLIRLNNALILLVFLLEGILKAFYYSLVESKSAEGYRKKNEELKLSEHNLKDIFENIYDGIVIMDAEGYIVECNKAAKNLLEITDCEKLHIKDLVYQDDVEKSNFYLNQLQEKGFYTGYEGRIISKKGNVKYVEVNSVAILDEHGNLTGSRDIIRDISVKKKQEGLVLQKMEELNSKNIELEKYIASNHQLENFAYLASHDLKAPTRTIKSFAQLLEKSLKDRISESEKEYLEFINNAATNMSHLIESLLTYSLVDKQEYSFKPCHLHDELDSVLAGMHSNIVENNAQVVVQNFPNNLNVDSTFIKQLFQNLIANAIKFKKENVDPIVIIEAVEKESEYLFKIQDNGIGIKEEYFDEIFLLFRKLNAGDFYNGTGIGLAMCTSIVREHKGKLWVESEFGQGTTFYFTISKGLGEKPRVRIPEVANAGHSLLSSN